MAGIRSGRPVAWLGSTMIGRCESPLQFGTAARSRRFQRRLVEARIPRSQRITCMFPFDRTYSADISRSSTVALIPALEQHGALRLADFRQQVEVLHVPGADLEHVGVLVDQIDLPGVHDLGHDRHLELIAHGRGAP